MSHIQTQTEWEEEMSAKILNFVRRELYLEFRYMEMALSAFSYKKIDGLLTFATDGRYLYYSTEPVFRLFEKNTPFLDRAYLHVVFHCIFKHLWIRGSQDQRLWDLACDIAVEYTIDSLHAECTKRILSYIRQQTYELLRAEGAVSAAMICRLLKEQKAEQIAVLEQEFYTDDHRFWPKEEEMQSPLVTEAKQNWDKTARSVTLEKNRRGDDPKEGEEVLNAQIRAGKSRRSYRDFLQKFAILQEEVHLDLDEFDLGFYTYGLKLYGNLPLIEPLESREVHKIKEFVIVIDTSDSTSGALVTGFLEETFSILKQKHNFFEKCHIRILQCDDKVQMDTKIESQKDLTHLLQEFSFVGGGGTDFRPAFSYIEELRRHGEFKNLGGLLYFTDGKGIYPEKKPDFKTAFLFLEDYDETAIPPWAMRLRLEPEEFES